MSYMRCYLLVRNVLYHKRCSVIFPPLYAVNIKFKLFHVSQVWHAFISTASNTFVSIKWINHMVSSRKHQAPLVMETESKIIREDLKVNTASPKMGKDVMRNKVNTMGCCITGKTHIPNRAGIEGRSLRRVPCIGMSSVPKRSWMHMLVIYG